MGVTELSLEKTLMLGKTEDKRRRGKQRKRWLESITDSMDMNLRKLQDLQRTGKLGMLQCMGSPRVRHCLVTEQQQSSTPTELLQLKPRDICGTGF